MQLYTLFLQCFNIEGDCNAQAGAMLGQSIYLQQVDNEKALYCSGCNRDICNCLFSTAFYSMGRWRAAGQVLQSISTREVPSAGTLEVAFSPKQGAETLVLKAIDSARSSIKVMAYLFTSSKVTVYH